MRLPVIIALGTAVALAAAACGSNVGTCHAGGTASPSNSHNVADAAAASGAKAAAARNPTGWQLLPAAPARTVPDFLVGDRCW